MKFSIIIPVYNVAPYLRECLDSVLAAARMLKKIDGENGCTVDGTGSDYCAREDTRTTGVRSPLVEIICVDDGSTDGSGEILDEWKKKIGGENRWTVVVIHQANAGVSAARNRALEVATGDWILFVDADDVIAPCALSHLAETILKTPQADVIAFKTRRFTDGEAPALAVVSTPLVIGRTIDSHSQLDARNATSNFWGKAYRCSIIGDIRFSPYTVGEDKLYLLQALLRSCWTVEINSFLYGYRMRPHSAMHTCVTVRKVRDRMQYSMDELMAIETSPKAVSPAMIRNVANWETEQVAIGLAQLSKSERCYVFKEWCRLLKRFSSLKRISLFQRIRARLFLFCPLWEVAELLFSVPAFLKIHFASKHKKG